MASSSKRRTRSEIKTQRSKSFTTIVDPQQDEIQISAKFRNDWCAELEYKPFGYLIHPTGNIVSLEFHITNVECYMTPGKMISVLYGIKEPVKVLFKYHCDDEKENYFKMIIIRQEDIIDVSSDDEEDGIAIPTSDFYILSEFNNNRISGWELLVSKASANTNKKKEQVLHIPTLTAKHILTKQKSIVIITQHELHGTKCTIKEYKRKTGRYKGRIEKYLTDGWYDFVKANNLKKGDKLQFQLSDPPRAIVVDIIRCRQ